MIFMRTLIYQDERISQAILLLYYSDKYYRDKYYFFESIIKECCEMIFKMSYTYDYVNF